MQRNNGTGADHGRELDAQLDALDRRLRRQRLRRGAAAAVLIVLGLVSAAALLDYALVLDISARRLVCAGLYAVALGLVARLLLRRLRPIPRRGLAWNIENRVPGLGEGLISAVEFEDGPNPHLSAEMIARVRTDAAGELGRLDPENLFAFARRTLVLPAVVVLLFGVALLTPPLRWGRLVKRVVWPSIHDAAVGRFDLAVRAPRDDRRGEGTPVRFEVACSDPAVEEVELCLENTRLRRVRMLPGGQPGSFVCELDDLRRDVEYWARSGRVTSHRYTLRILPRPRVLGFEVRYRFPDYTGLADAVEETGTGDLRGYPGTVVDLGVRVSEPVVQAGLDWFGQDVPGRIEPDGRAARFEVEIEESGLYTLELANAAGLGPPGKQLYRVEALEDEAPRVRWIEPAEDRAVRMDESLPIRWEAADDFGIRQQQLRFRFGKNTDSRVLELDPGTSGFAWNLAELPLQGAWELVCWLHVADHGGHSAESRRRRLHLVRDRVLEDGGRFANAAAELEAALETAHEQMDLVQRLQRRVRDAARYENGSGATELEHHRLMLRQAQGRLEQELREGAAAAQRMTQHAIFPRGVDGGDALESYLEQERIATLPELLALDAGTEAAGAVREMLELSGDLTSELEERSELETRRRRVDGLLDDAAAGQPLEEPAFALAGEMDSVQVSDWREPAETDKAVHGLRGRYYFGQDDYVTGTNAAVRTPTFVRVDPQLRFPDHAAFGAEDAPYAVTWSGFLEVPADGRYTFFVNSDEGSRLLINGQPVVRNDGRHGPRERSGAVNLGEGLHTIHVLFFNAYGAGSLTASWQPPGQGKAVIPAKVLYSDHPAGRATRLAALQEEAARAAADTRRIDQLIRTVRERLRRPDEQLELLAERAELYDRAETWSAVSGMAEQVSRDPAPAAADLAATLTDAAERREPGQVREAQDAVGRLDTAAAVREFARREAEVAARVGESLNQAETALTSGTPHTADRPLREAHVDLARLHATPVQGVAADRHPLTRAAAQRAHRAAQAAERAWAAVRGLEPLQATEPLEQARAELDAMRAEAVKALQQAAELERLAALQESTAVAAELPRRLRALADASGRMSAEARRRAADALDAAARTGVPAEQVRGLADAARLARASAELDRAADGAARLRERPDTGAARELADDVDEVADGLEQMLGGAAPGDDGASATQAPVPESALDPDRVRDGLQRLRGEWVEAASAMDAAAALRERLRPDRRRAQQLLDGIETASMPPREARHVRGARDRVASEDMRTNARRLQEAARLLTNRDPDRKKELEEHARVLQQQAGEEQRADALERDAAGRVDRMEPTVDQMRTELDKAPSLSAPVLRNRLAEFRDRMRVGQPDAAMGELERFEEELRALERDLRKTDAPRPSVEEGKADLAAALRRAGPEDKPVLEEAQRAVEAGDMDAAANGAGTVARRHSPEVELAEALAREADAGERELVALEQAAESARRNRFGEAAVRAARVEEAAETAQELAGVEQALTLSARRALAAARAGETPAERRLGQAAQHVMADNLDRAAAETRAAGEVGQELRETVEQAARAGQAAAESLERLREELVQARRERVASMLDRAERRVARPGQRTEDGAPVTDRDDGAEAEKAAAAGKAGEAASTERRLNGLQPVRAAVEQDRLDRARDAATHAAAGGVEADRAARAFRGARTPEAAEQARAELSTATERARLTPEEASRTAAATEEVRTAQARLAGGEAGEQTPDRLSDASRELAEVAAARMRRTASALQSTASQPNGRPPLSDRPSQGADRADAATAAPQPVPPGPGAPRAGLDSWAGVESGLSSDDRRGGVSRYDEYYRKAIERYLEAIHARKQNSP